MMRRLVHVRGRRFGLIGGLIVGLAAVGSGLAAEGAFSSGSPGVSAPPLQSTRAAQAMAGALAQPSTNSIPANVSSEAVSVAASVPSGAPNPPGEVLVSQGRLLLSNLGADGRAIYAFPTANGAVCYVLTGLGSGCKSAFPVGEPATVDGGSLYFPSSSGPPGELAGLTEDDVTDVQVVINGAPHDAIVGNDAWYYRFPDTQTPATAASELIVTQKDGSTTTVPSNITAPPKPND